MNPLDPRESVRRLVIVCGGLTGALLLWWLFAGVLVPQLLRLAHQGRSIPLFSRLMTGRDITPIEAYLATWAEFYQGGLLIGFALFLLSLCLALTLPVTLRHLTRFRFLRGATRATEGIVWVVLLLVLVAGVTVLGRAFPVTYTYVITEDYWVEYATFVAFVLAGIFFLWAAVVSPAHRTLGPVLFALAAFFVGLEEVSWGQRILGLETPDVLAAHNFQGELTLHNIWFPRHTVVGLAVLFYGLGFPALSSRWGALGGVVARWKIPVPPPPLRPVFAIAGGLLFLASPVPPYLRYDELGELALGIAICLLALGVAFEAIHGREADGGEALSAGGVTLGVTLLVTGLMVWEAPSHNELRWQLHDFAIERYPASGMHPQALALFEYMARDPDLQVQYTLVEYGKLLMEVGEAEQAEQVLEEALATQQAALLGDDEDARAVAHRLSGEIHHLLDDEDRAMAALETALDKDDQALSEAGSPGERAWIHWSMAQTAHVAGDAERACDHAGMASAEAEEMILRQRVDDWIEAECGADPAAR